MKYEQTVGGWEEIEKITIQRGFKDRKGLYKIPPHYLTRRISKSGKLFTHRASADLKDFTR